MKGIYLSLNNDSLKYRGHSYFLAHIALEIAYYNGGKYGSIADEFIRQLFKDSDFIFEQIDDAHFKFGHKKTFGEVEYGTIIKINIL